MKKTLQLLFILIVLSLTFILNLFGLMRLLPMILTLPIFFITIYLSLSFFFYRNTFRGFK
ncbi:hypothetical protein [Amphibacillus cookii]|uniref:hypothetical protein n=1 Tax=Amphibacillus cookii TaxID=767787 RepID=UPI00195B3941|nr:hypothetical protein [Amphibacillus cookii]MBM7540173.1 phosphoglycerol transferase MdoB-like AlkP superfamily enzyme [Amphibacillus cookii]